MTDTQRQSELFSQLAEPFTGEALFDCLPDLVFFIKNARGEYVVVNETLVARCGCRHKSELLGRRADTLFPAPLGTSYVAQDESVLRNGAGFRNQLELHFYPGGGRGWCLTNKLPLRGRDGRVVGLMGISQDLQTANERGEDYSAVAKAVRHIQENYSTGQLIQKTRMEAAVRRLRETNDSIVTVALDCGYSDQSAFTRQFRQTTGMSPSEYRATCGEQL